MKYRGFFTLIALLLWVLTISVCAGEETLLYEDFEYPSSEGQEIVGWNNWSVKTSTEDYTLDSEYKIIAEPNTENKMAWLYRPTSNDNSRLYLLEKTLEKPVSTGMVSIQFKVQRRNRNARNFLVAVGDSKKNLWEVYFSFTQSFISPVEAEGAYFGELGEDGPIQLRKWHNMEMLIDFHKKQFVLREDGKALSGAQPIPATKNAGDISSFYFGTPRRDAGNGAQVYVDDIKITKVDLPRVEKAFPEDGERYADINTKVQLFFNNAIAPASVSIANMLVKQGDGTITAAKLDPATGKRLDIFINKMDYHTQYELLLTGITDIYGQPLSEIPLTFTTREKGFTFKNFRFYKNYDKNDSKDITASGAEWGEITFTADFEDENIMLSSAVVLMAQFHGNILKNISIEDWSTQTNGGKKSGRADITVFNDEGGDISLKIFLLSDLKNLTPVWQKIVFDQEGLPYDSQEVQTVFYISPEGNDTHSGTIDRPWKTLSKATQTVKAGDTVIVKDGIYYETKVTYFKNSGNENGAITIKAQNKNSAVIIYPETARLISKFNILQGQSYIAVQDLVFRQVGIATEEDIAPTNDIFIRCEGSNCTISGNHISGAYEEGIKMYLSRNCVVENNYIENMNHEGIDMVNCLDGIVRNNTIVEVGRCGIMVKGGSRNCQIYNNYIYNENTSLSFAAITVGGSTNGTVSLDIRKDTGFEQYNCQIYNNIIYSPNRRIQAAFGPQSSKGCRIYNNSVIGVRFGIRFFLSTGLDKDWEWDPPIVDLEIYNNIFLNCTTTYQFDIQPKSMVSDYNLFYNSGSVPAEAHSIYQNPLFVDGGNGDFRLAANSPAIGKGLEIPAEFIGFQGKEKHTALTDYAGNNRSVPWDIGAFAFKGQR